MRQGRFIPVCLAFALGLGTFTGTPVLAAAKKSDAAPRATKAKNTLRQFTGYVSAVDKTTLTVEKRASSLARWCSRSTRNIKTVGGSNKMNSVPRLY
jgi:hypothetical protein